MGFATLAELSRASFACDRNARKPGASRSAPLHRLHHSLDNGIPVRRGRLHATNHLWLGGVKHLAVGRDNLAHQMRTIENAPIGDAHRGDRHLERGHKQIALPDAVVERLPSKPRLLIYGAFPVGVGHKPFAFVG
jgi:hypothetical protein